MTNIILFIIVFFCTYILALMIVEARIKDKENDKLMNNIKKHETRTGALENDRINERP